VIYYTGEEREGDREKGGNGLLRRGDKEKLGVEGENPLERGEITEKGEMYSMGKPPGFNPATFIPRGKYRKLQSIPLICF